MFPWRLMLVLMEIWLTAWSCIIGEGNRCHERYRAHDWRRRFPSAAPFNLSGPSTHADAAQSSNQPLFVPAWPIPLLGPRPQKRLSWDFGSGGCCPSLAELSGINSKPGWGLASPRYPAREVSRPDDCRL
ncbi:hypothetical protein HDV57DRAFT_508939 [Trichoderma longibrachiatum]|uniref:Secreted protein n=1 Tax=Trichoderma longibrachiatum ATCC 18648 TaxID=983965 RepID=A0A2T4BPW6_TRILO|nr:hypothetical protein M440DRAFT_216603 [Trichoderma longibrachiatum ATCC 18648]